MIWLTRLLVVLTLPALVSGFAFTKTSTLVTFTPEVFEPIANVKSNVRVGEVKDSRPVTENLVLVQKHNAYGKTTGAYVTRQPVAELFRDALVLNLRTNGFQIVAHDGKFELRTDLQEFDYDVIGGFWTATVKPKMLVRFELIDLATTNSVWRDTFTGRSEHKTAWGDADFVARTFTTTADDVMRKLITDRSFRKFFE